jgi:hypothetical protein
MMRIVIVGLLAGVVCVQPASAHVGSPNVFYEDDAGPYRLFVSIRTPDVIPGIATIEIRTDSSDVREVTVVPLRLTGPGSELPPTPDLAERSPDDPQFFTASLWLMEHGSLQVRVAVDGARGSGKLAIPVPAVAQRTLGLDAGLGALLFGLMLLLALGVVSIVAGAIREATLEPGALPSARDRRRSRIAMVVVGGVVVGVLAVGNAWWNAEAATYAGFVAKPWRFTPRRDGCTLILPPVQAELLPDHGHEMHLFVVRVPSLDRLAHLHPRRLASGELVQTLPTLPAGRYQLFADIVTTSGFPVTGTGEIELPELHCEPQTGDDSAWAGPPVQPTAIAELGGGARMIWEHGALRANVAMPLRFRVEDRDGRPIALEPYMGMAGHAAILRTDLTVFAHLHPTGSIAMPALALARAGLTSTPLDPHADHAMHAGLPPLLAFPYGFPRAGRYRVFVQVKRAGRVETGAFDVDVEP